MVGPIKPVTDNGNEMLFTAICPFSRFPIIVPVSDKKAETIALVILNNIILKYGCPAVIQSDNGREFVNETVAALTKLFEINQTFGSSYRPQAQSPVERMHRTLNGLLRIFCDKYPNNWDVFIPQLEFILKTTPIGTTAVTPFEVVHGFKATFPFDLITQPRIAAKISPEAYIEDVFRSMKQFRDIVKDQDYKNRESREQASDEVYRYHEFAVGDFVVLTEPPKKEEEMKKLTVSTRLLPKATGPYVIVKKISSDMYILGDIETGKELDVRFKNPIHISRLLEFLMPPISPAMSTTVTPRRISVSIPDLSDAYHWYDGVIVEVGTFANVKVKWDNNDPTEWINLQNYRYKWI
jgi:hypothetical protein